MALVIDDELDLCLLLTRHLQHFDFETSYALTFKDAIDQINAEIYKLIFIDITLPDGSGFDIIEHIKSSNLSSIIIVISAYHHEAPKALGMGANLFIPKPFSMKSINQALKAMDMLPV